jgi:phospholipid/cholesterol/gamma-HCH transport system ATP-binding protein
MQTPKAENTVSRPAAETSDSGESLIEFKNVTKRFGSLTVLNRVNLSIHRGEITTVIGKSGMGKTVLLKHIIGLIEPDEGEILFENRILNRMNRRDRQHFKTRFGYLFQNVALFDSMNVFDNVALPLRENTDQSEADIRKRVYDKLEKLEISEITEKFPAEISGGMKKRVGLARALIMDPEIVLFDEPTTGLDPIRKNAVHSMISHMQKKFGFTGIIVSHEIPDVFFISQKIAMLDSGRILCDCSPQEIEEIKIPEVQQFIKGVENLKDELTGLHSKSRIAQKFSEKLPPEMSREAQFSIIVFKINGLDLINENLGFVAGQKVIQHFASFVEHYLRISGEHSRYSDDLILTLLPNTKIGMAKILLDKLKNSLKDYPPLPSQGYQRINYSISAGIAEAGENPRLDDIVEQAKKNMLVIGYFDLS